MHSTVKHMTTSNVTNHGDGSLQNSITSSPLKTQSRKNTTYNSNHCQQKRIITINGPVTTLMVDVYPAKVIAENDPSSVNVELGN